MTDKPATLNLNELAAALAAFQAKVPVVPKKRTAKIQTERGRDYSYSYADLATIAPVVMPLLAECGLAFTTRPKAGKGDRGPMLVAMLLHTSGQYLTGELPITGRSPQEIGSSLTYGRRYLLGCLTGVVTDDDDDGQLAEAAAKKAPRPPVAPDDPAPAPIQRKARPRAPETPAGEVSDVARRALFAAIGKTLGPGATRAERLALCAAVVGRPLESSTELDATDVSKVLTWVDGYNAGWNLWTWDPETETGAIDRRPDPAADTPPEVDPWP